MALEFELINILDNAHQYDQENQKLSDNLDQQF